MTTSHEAMNAQWILGVQYTINVFICHFFSLVGPDIHTIQVQVGRPPAHEAFPLPNNNKLTEIPFLNQIEKFSKEKAGKYGAGMIDFHTTPLQR
jgi:hypothetical protein